MVGKRRKKGDWIQVAKGRASKQRDLENGHGLSAFPAPNAVGSAAYRRLMASKSGNKRVSK